MTATVVTHGCRSNLAERDALVALAPAGATVVNSCAVTADAVRDARVAVKRALADGPVVVTGCAVAVAPERFADLPVRLVAPAEKLLGASWGRAGAAPAVTRASRGFVAIQDGCDHECTFCVTRLARGPSRSVPLAAVVGRVAGLARAGVAEVVLTGIDATGWGADLPGAPRLGLLVAAILRQVPDLPRLRLSSLDPSEMDDDLVAAFADPRLMPQLHLSLQSGDPLILKRMRRRHTPADALRLVAAVRAVRPDVAVGADLIAGFPTEGEAAHRNSLALIAGLGLVAAHVFPYSPRPGTAASRMPPVPPAITRRRAAELRVAAGVARDAFLTSQVGLAQPVVSEGAKGITPHGATLRFAAARPRGSLVTAVPARLTDGMLTE